MDWTYDDEYPDQCEFRWVCPAHRYAHAFECLAWSVSGFPFDWACPSCGFNTVSMDGPPPETMYAMLPEARIAMLDMVGCIDAPLDNA